MVPGKILQDLNERLEDLEKKIGAKSITLVQTNGLYVAGSIPEGVHKETYAAQAAIAYGTCKVIGSEIKKTSDGVLLNYGDENEDDFIYICGMGDAVLVARLRQDGDLYFDTKLKEAVMDFGRLIFYEEQQKEQKAADERAQEAAEKKL